VKRFRDSKTGAERLWIEPGEIEARTEAELVKAGLMPTVDAPAIDVEAFVEQHLGASSTSTPRYRPTCSGRPTSASALLRW
jgi:hypothetical protein